MPECLILGENETAAFSWQLAIENLDETWRCQIFTGADSAYQWLMTQPCQVTVALEGQKARRLIQLMQERPPLASPWLLTEAPCPWADGTLTQPYQLPELMADWQRAGRIPRLAYQRHGQVLCLARGLMGTLTVPSRLGAWRFLPDMAALCTVHPPLMEDLRGRLYPLAGRRHGMSPAAVERSLRLAIESTWSGASLPALERFFGHSVDPERGKPTNREFLCRVQERLTLAAGRIA